MRSRARLQRDIGQCRFDDLCSEQKKIAKNMAIHATGNRNVSAMKNTCDYPIPETRVEPERERNLSATSRPKLEPNSDYSDQPEIVAQAGFDFDRRDTPTPNYPNTLQVISVCAAQFDIYDCCGTT